MRKEAPTPRAEFLIALAGPAVSFAIGGICWLLVEVAQTIQQQQGLRGVIMLGALLGMVNVQLGLFNLIPGFPLDGGRVLRAGLWAWGKDFYRATKHASVGGLVFGAAFGMWGLYRMYKVASGELDASLLWSGGWILLIGMFLSAAALTSRRQAVLRESLASIPVRNLMVTTVASIPSQCTLDEAVNRYFQPYGYGGFPVVADRQLVGLITVFDIQNVSPSLWPWRRVEQVMRPISEALVVTPETPVIQAMGCMAREGWDRLIVMQDGEIVGLVTHSAIVHFLQLRRAA